MVRWKITKWQESLIRKWYGKDADVVIQWIGRNMVDCLRYEHPSRLSYEELMTGKRFIATDRDLASGTNVILVEYDAESAWPIIEWIDGEGVTRLTTIDPVIFAEFFTPILKEGDIQW